MKNVTWNDVSEDCQVVTLDEQEVEEVSGGVLPIAVIGAVVAVSWTAGYLAGSDYANNRNRNNGPVRRR